MSDESKSIQNREVEIAMLSAAIPESLKEKGWKIGDEGKYYIIYQTHGKSHILLGFSFDQIQDDLRRWILILNL